MWPFAHLLRKLLGFPNLVPRAAEKISLNGPSKNEIGRKHVLRSKDKDRLIIGGFAEASFAASGAFAFVFCKSHAFLLINLIHEDDDGAARRPAAPADDVVGMPFGAGDALGQP